MRTELKEKENLILEVKKHWIVLIQPVSYIAGVIAIFMYVSSDVGIFTEYRDMLLSLLSVAAVCCVLYLFYAYVDRKTDIWAVTNMRVIDEWGIFSRNVKESALDKIHNISFNQPFLGMLLDFGDVTIQTAAENGKTVNRFVTSPKSLQNTIKNIQSQEITANLPEEQKEQNSKECPFCAEIIKEKAKLCRYCGKNLIDTEGSKHGRK